MQLQIRWIFMEKCPGSLFNVLPCPYVYFFDFIQLLCYLNCGKIHTDGKIK